MRPISLKALPSYIRAALKRREEERLYRAYTATFAQLIMQHKSTEALPLYVEALKDIYPDKEPKKKQKTDAETIEYLRQKLIKAENLRTGGQKT